MAMLPASSLTRSRITSYNVCYTKLLRTEQAKLRAADLGVAHQVKFIHGDAAGYVSDEKVSVAACVGASYNFV